MKQGKTHEKSTFHLQRFNLILRIGEKYEIQCRGVNKSEIAIAKYDIILRNNGKKVRKCQNAMPQYINNCFMQEFVIQTNAYRGNIGKNSQIPIPLYINNCLLQNIVLQILDKSGNKGRCTMYPVPIYINNCLLDIFVLQSFMDVRKNG